MLRLLAVLAVLFALTAAPASAATFRFAPIGDTHGRADFPNQAYGASKTLRVDGSPVSTAYLKFNVRGLTRTVRRATLRLYTRSVVGYKGLELRSAPSTWTEAGLTYATAPAPGTVAGRTGGAASGVYVELDATALVRANGTLSLAVTSPGPDSRSLASREDATAAYRPQLVVEERPHLGGAQVHPLWGNQTVADFDRDLDAARAAGMDTVRMDLGWSTLEAEGKGRYSAWYLQKADTFFSHAAARGLRVIVTLWTTPCWASSAPPDVKQDCAGAWWDRGVDRYPPSSATDFADIANWVTRRWGSQIHALEIWNEPNLPGFMRGPDPAAAYAGLLKAAYPRIKAARPSMLVLGGATAYSDGAFVKDLYDRLGIKGSLDGLSYHPFAGRDPDDRSTSVAPKHSYQLGTEWLRQILVERGDSAVGLWITEVGYPTCTAGSHSWCVTPEVQAERVVDTYRIARERWPYVRAINTYNLRNNGTDPSYFDDQMGLLWHDWRPKPAYTALKAELTR